MKWRICAVITIIRLIMSQSTIRKSYKLSHLTAMPGTQETVQVLSPATEKPLVWKYAIQWTMAIPEHMPPVTEKPKTTRPCMRLTSLNNTDGVQTDYVNTGTIQEKTVHIR